MAGAFFTAIHREAALMFPCSRDLRGSTRKLPRRLWQQIARSIFDIDRSGRQEENDREHGARRPIRTALFLGRWPARSLARLALLFASLPAHDVSPKRAMTCNCRSTR